MEFYGHIIDNEEVPSLDGATMPADLKDAAGLPKLIDVLRGRGYDDDALYKIGYENWLRVLEVTWGM